MVAVKVARKAEEWAVVTELLNIQKHHIQHHVHSKKLRHSCTVKMLQVLSNNCKRIHSSHDMFLDLDTRLVSHLDNLV